MSPAFFDTNALIYANSDGDKRQAVAEALIAEGGRISVQTLNEFVSVSRGGCTTLYSEDLHDGQVIGPLTIRNPFL